MKTVVIEDEPLVAKDLQKLIKQVDSNIEIVAVLHSLQSCVDYFKSNVSPDLIFMDIQLSDGVSFDLFNHVTIGCPIIFTTAYNEYAIRAFKVNSIDYLLKPIAKDELSNAIEKFKNLQSPRGIDLKEQVQMVISQLALPAADKIYKERFTVHSGKSFSIIHFAQVAYFVKDTLIYLVTNDKQQFLTDYETMEEIEELLNPKYFYRANRQFIINVNAVDSFRTDIYSKMVLQLKAPLNVTVDISREKAPSFKKWIE